MANVDHSGLSPDALERIELARQKAHSILAAAQAQAYTDRVAWLNTHISPEWDDLLEADAMTSPTINEGRQSAMQLYFSAMAYEHYVTMASVAAFEEVLQQRAIDAATELSCHIDVLATLIQQWVARASGREAVEMPTFQRAFPGFWQELGAEFVRLDGADLRAVLKDDGWWSVSGGPTDPAARQALTGQFGLLIRRGMAALGFYDRTVAVHIWLDVLLKISPHSSDRSIDHLSFACPDYCLELEARSMEGEVASLQTSSSPREKGTRDSGSPQAVMADPQTQSDYVFRKQDNVWTICFERKTVFVPHLKGLGYIAELLRRPGLGIEAAKLAGAWEEPATFAPQPGLQMADEPTLKEVHAELDRKKAELAALAKNDWVRRGSLNEEIAKLEEYLSEVEDHRGQARKVVGTAQRSRTAVTNAINRAIDQLSAPHPALGRHLKESIKTGIAVIYAPAEVLDWQF
jgi:hypothetical protein